MLLRSAKEASTGQASTSKITEFISTCSISNSYKPEQQEEPLNMSRNKCTTMAEHLSRPFRAQ